jgi:hypothetical protein
MKLSKIGIFLIMTAGLCFFAAPTLADNTNILYQTTFSENPKWTTNNPSTDYWDSGKGAYHFGIEPSTQGYAYSPAINYNGGPFTYEYDVTLNRVDDGATFRFGFSDADMDLSQGPNVLTDFSNVKYGYIMGLTVITQSAKLEDIDSYMGSYGGPTVRYELNTTYHVTVVYSDVTNTVTETVVNKQTGQQVWSYYVGTQEPLRGMNRVYIGSKGDYGQMSIYAIGYLDNVRVSSPAAEVTTVPTTIPASAIPTYDVSKSVKTTTAVSLPTHMQTTATRQSPLNGVIALTAMGIAGILVAMQYRKKE